MKPPVLTKALCLGCRKVKWCMLSGRVTECAICESERTEREKASRRAGEIGGALAAWFSIAVGVGRA